MKDNIPTSKDIMEACATTNPTLWRLFCAVCQRPVDSISPHWTEQDVCTLLYSYAKEGRVIHLKQMREITTNDAGRTAERSDKDTVVKFGHRNNNWSDPASSDVLAVWTPSDSKVGGNSSSSS